MPSTYSTHLLLELMADGENEGLWGDITNTNLEIIGRAISGSTNVTLVGTTHTLSVAQGSLSEGHYSVLVLGGAPTGTNTITISPNTVPRIYLVKNDSGQDAVFTQGSGGDATVVNGDIGILFSDGGGASASVTDLTPGLMRNSENLSGLADAATALQNLGVTATAAEINTLNGFTGVTADLTYAKDLRATGVTTTEFDKLDGLTASTAELNTLDGITATTAELNKLDGVTISTAEINFLDGVTGVIQRQLDGKISGIIVDKGLSGGAVSGNALIEGVTQSTATWKAGTSTTEGVVTPAKVAASAEVNSPVSGAVMAFAMNTAPTGWLKCDGSAVSRTTYASLFSALGTTYGSGDGSATFNLPDLRGEFVRGWDDGRGVDGGRSFATAQGDELKSHTHDLFAQTGGENTFQYDKPPSFPDHGVSGHKGSGREGFRGGLIQSTTGSETRPRNIALLYCIKT